MSRKRRRRMSDMNVVPYIDVMLVLLIIFMITSPLLTQSVNVELPSVKQAESIESQKQKKLIIVTIDALGQFFLEDEQPLTMETLLARVIAKLRLAPDSPILVRGDAKVAYGNVVELMASLQEAGVEKVGLLTKPLKNK
jgi:biopolymer transport protein TolR